MDVNTINDRVQQSKNRRECAGALTGTTVAQLRAVCDLNHWDTEGARVTLTRRILAEMHGDYRPGRSMVGEATPQSHPDRFTDDDLRAEIKYLLRLNMKYGSAPLRTVAYTRLLHILVERKASVAR